jgi:cyclopropane-fatty-acyl-phospholipid synthase
LGRDWELIHADFSTYDTDRTYDAIVIMGVIEHLPQYKKVLDKFVKYLKPGRRVFIDASACTKKYELSSYMEKYIYGGNHCFLVLHHFLEKLVKLRSSSWLFITTATAIFLPLSNGRGISTKTKSR